MAELALVSRYRNRNRPKKKTKKNDVGGDDESAGRDQSLQGAAEEMEQVSDDVAIENDLAYLLTNEEVEVVLQDETEYIPTGKFTEINIGVSQTQHPAKSGKKVDKDASRRKRVEPRFSVAEVVSDIADLQFSSDEEEKYNHTREATSVNGKRKGKMNSKNSTSKAPKGRRDKIENSGEHVDQGKIHKPRNAQVRAHEHPPACSNSGPGPKQSRKNTKREHTTNSAHIQQGIDGNQDFESKSAHPKEQDGLAAQGQDAKAKSSSKTVKKKSATRTPKNDAKGPPASTTTTTTPQKKSASKDKNKKSADASRKQGKSARDQDMQKSPESRPSIPADEEKAEGNGTSKREITEEEYMATHCPTLSQELKENEGSKKTKKKNKGKSGESAREREKTPVDESSASSTISPGSMFGVTLNPINSSTKKIMGDQLPEVHPIKTIIGVSHSQILEADLTDVKIKTILSSTAVSKYAIMGRALTKKYSTELFGNAETKKMFTELCINVALHESYGFKTTTQKYPNLLPLLNQYDELQLENTRTSITVSEKETHSNTLDYSVFAYFGHILIWAISLQRLASVSLLTENCDVDVSPATIKSKIGGLHLWDRIFRELKGMNSKRWKHVLKFRNNFAFEEDQFMLILRFMQIVNVP